MHFRQTYNQAPSRLAALDIETLAPTQSDGSFPPWPKHRPIVASVLSADQVNYGQWRFAIESVTFEDERAAIARVDQLLEGHRCLSYNGRGFDLPVLAMTAMRCSMFECRNLTDAWTSHRFKGSHIDVADLISGFGAAPRASLEMLCEEAGIPVKRTGHGGDVAEMLRDHGIAKVASYCEEDTAATICKYAMVQALRSNDTAYAASLLCDLADWIRDAGHQHLVAFRNLSANPLLQRARLQHRLDEGLRALQDRARSNFFGGHPTRSASSSKAG